MKKRKLIVGVIAVLVICGAGIGVYSKFYAPKPKQPARLILNDKNNTITSFQTPSIAEIRKLHASPQDRYDLMHSYASTQKQYGGIDLAIEYYKAMVEEASGDEAKIEFANLNIYALAKKHGKTDLEKEYKKILGDKTSQFGNKE